MPQCMHDHATVCERYHTYVHCNASVHVRRHTAVHARYHTAVYSRIAAVHASRSVHTGRHVALACPCCTKVALFARLPHAGCAQCPHRNEGVLVSQFTRGLIAKFMHVLAASCFCFMSAIVCVDPINIFASAHAPFRRSPAATSALCEPLFAAAAASCHGTRHSILTMWLIRARTPCNSATVQIPIVPRPRWTWHTPSVCCDRYHVADVVHYADTRFYAPSNMPRLGYWASFPPHGRYARAILQRDRVE
jgi:hypothetical protein